MEEDKKKELAEETKETPLDKLKDFTCKHGKKIAIGAGAAAITIGTVIFFKKNPEVGERLLISLNGFFNSDEEPKIIEITDVAEIDDDLLELPQDIDLTKTYSATRLGNMVGKSGRETNSILKEQGFMEGEPGFYRPTEKGKPFCIEKAEDNGYGGYAARSWGWLEWSKDILPLLGIGNPEEHLIEVNQNRTKAGLEPISEIA